VPQFVTCGLSGGEGSFVKVLDCTIKYLTVLYCTILYCTVLYCTVLYCIIGGREGGHLVTGIVLRIKLTWVLALPRVEEGGI